MKNVYNEIENFYIERRIGMLKVDHVTKYYGDFLAVDDLSFEVNDGEFFGLL